MTIHQALFFLLDYYRQAPLAQWMVTWRAHPEQEILFEGQDGDDIVEVIAWWAVIKDQ